MKRTSLLLSLIVALGIAVHGQGGGVMVFDGARILDGNGGAPIENGRLVIQNGRVTAVGTAAAVVMPQGAARVDLTGKTIMPAMINVHAHMGYEAYSTWGARN